MLSTDEIKKIAILSRLNLPEGDELKQLQNSLTDILELIQKLETLDTQDITPLSHPITMAQRLRQDLVTENNERENFQKSAPLTADGFYLVPKVIE